MSLASPVINRLFFRMHSTYGKDWVYQNSGVDDSNLRDVWAHGLGGFAQRLDCIAWALDHLPLKVPNVLVFKALCRQAPDLPKPPEIEYTPDPEKLAENLGKLGKFTSQPKEARGNKEWAYKIVDAVDRGDKRSGIGVKWATEVVDAERARVA